MSDKPKEEPAEKSFYSKTVIMFEEGPEDLSQMPRQQRRLRKRLEEKELERLIREKTKG